MLCACGALSAVVVDSTHMNSTFQPNASSHPLTVVIQRKCIMGWADCPLYCQKACSWATRPCCARLALNFDIHFSERAVQLRLPVFLLATRVAEGRGVLDVMDVSTLPSEMACTEVPKFPKFILGRSWNRELQDFKILLF